MLDNLAWMETTHVTRVVGEAGRNKKWRLIGMGVSRKGVVEGIWGQAGLTFGGPVPSIV